MILTDRCNILYIRERYSPASKQMRKKGSRAPSAVVWLSPTRLLKITFFVKMFLRERGGERESKRRTNHQLLRVVDCKILNVRPAPRMSLLSLTPTVFNQYYYKKEAPPTFRTVHIGDDTKNDQSLAKEPHRVGPPATGPGHKTNEVVTSKVWLNPL